MKRLTGTLPNARVLIPFGVVVLVYAGLRILAFAGGDLAVLRYWDTTVYEQISQNPVWHPSFYLNERPFTLPLYYKIIGQFGGEKVTIIGQLAISIVSWTFLAAVVASSLSRRWLQLTGFSVILLFSLAFPIILWDGMLLSESLSTSLTAVLIGAWLLFLRRQTTPALALVVIATLLWASVRDTNNYVLLVLIPLLALWLLRPGPKRLRLAALVTTGAIFLGASVAADSPAGHQYKRWRGPLSDSLLGRVVPDREGLAHLKESGMPVVPALEEATNRWERADDWFADPDPVEYQRWLELVPKGVFEHYDPYERPPESAAYYDWLLESGRRAYATFMLLHPVETLMSAWRHREEIFAPPSTTRWAAQTSDTVWTYGDRALPRPLEDAIYPPSFTATGWVLLAVAALAAVVAVRFRPDMRWWIPVFLIVSTVPHALVTWHGSAFVDIDRHSIGPAMMLRLGTLLLLILAVDSLLRARSRRRAQSNDDATLVPAAMPVIGPGAPVPAGTSPGSRP